MGAPSVMHRDPERVALVIPSPTRGVTVSLSHRSLGVRGHEPRAARRSGCVRPRSDRVCGGAQGGHARLTTCVLARVRRLHQHPPKREVVCRWVCVARAGARAQ